jgi:hypothetical protein
MVLLSKETEALASTGSFRGPVQNDRPVVLKCENFSSGRVRKRGKKNSVNSSQDSLSYQQKTCCGLKDMSPPEEILWCWGSLRCGVCVQTASHRSAAFPLINSYNSGVCVALMCAFNLSFIAFII